MYNFDIVRGDGVYLVDKSGKKILDFATNFGANTLGCKSQIIEKPLIQQLHKNIFSQPEKINNKDKEILSSKLCQIAGFTTMKNGQKKNNGSVVFYNSSTEANEFAIKLARKRYNTLCDKDYNEIICFTNANHGDSLATMSASNNKHMFQFAPRIGGFRLAEFNNIKSVERLMNNNTCAIMIEPIQYLSGIKKCDTKFMQQIRELCNLHEIVLIVDETHCGSGRSGDFFAYKNHNILPDIITISSGFAGGFPLSACIYSNKFSTFTLPPNNDVLNGNALFYNIANNVIDYLNQENVLFNVKKQEKILKIYLEQLWKKYQHVINNFSVAGLMFSVQIREDLNCEMFAKTLLSNGLLVEIGNNNNILCFPPLTINEEQIEKAMKIIAICVEMISVLENY